MNTTEIDKIIKADGINYAPLAQSMASRHGYDLEPDLILGIHWEMRLCNPELDASAIFRKVVSEILLECKGHNAPKKVVVQEDEILDYLEINQSTTIPSHSTPESIAIESEMYQRNLELLTSNKAALPILNFINSSQEAICNTESLARQLKKRKQTAQKEFANELTIFEEIKRREMIATGGAI